MEITEGAFELVYGKFEAAIELEAAVVIIKTEPDSCLADLENCATTGLTLSTRMKFEVTVEEKV